MPSDSDTNPQGLLEERVLERVVDLTAGLLHLVNGDERLFDAARDRYEYKRESWLVYNHHMPGDHHGPHRSVARARPACQAWMSAPME